jgi:hypothetical protein
MKEIIEFGDRKFLLYRTIREFEKLEPNILKEYWYCDTVLKKEDIYLFLKGKGYKNIASIPLSDLEHKIEEHLRIKKVRL